MVDRARLFPTLILYALMLVPAVSLFRVWPLTSAVVDSLSLILVGLFAGVVLMTREDRYFRFNLPFLFFLSLIATLIVSVFLNEYSYESSWRWYLITLFFCLMVIVAGCELKSRDSEKFNFVVVGSIWVGCFVYGVMSLLKYYGGLKGIFQWMDPSSGRLSGIWFQPNLTTTTAWLGVLAGAVYCSKKSRLVWFSTSVVILGWVIACSASRMSWLMASGLLLLVAVSHLSGYRSAEARVAKLWLMSGVVAVIAMLVIVPPLNALIRELLSDLGILHDTLSISLLDRDIAQDSARLTEFSKLISSLGGLTTLEWLFGIGPGNYPEFSYSAEALIAPENLISATWLHSHNLFSMMFIEFGLVGLTLVIGLLALIVKKALSSRFDQRHFFSVGALGLVFIHSNLEFPLWYPWFLVICCLLLVNLFDVHEVRGESKSLKPAVGAVFIAMVLALFLNVGSQYIGIVKVALDPQPGDDDYQSLALFANDGLMGPYAVLRRYRDFPPESLNLEWQLNEARRMKLWQPRDLVVLREYSLLVLKGDVKGACSVSRDVAYRYPPSAPIMLEHAVKSGNIQPSDVVMIAKCIEKGLKPRGETIPSIDARNRKAVSQM